MGDGSDSWYCSAQFLKEETPSRLDGISYEEEMEIRRNQCGFIMELGKKLKTPQLTISTATVFFHRFFLRRSLKGLDSTFHGLACLFLAAKVEESPKRLRDVIFAFHELRFHKTITEKSSKYTGTKELILLREREILQTLAFDIKIKHPYSHLLTLVKKVLGNQHQSLAQVSWNFVNDSMRTPLCLQYQPAKIAAATIYLASKFLKLNLQVDGKPLSESLGVSLQDLDDISNQILDMFDALNPNKEAQAGGKASAPATPQQQRAAKAGQQQQQQQQQQRAGGGGAPRQQRGTGGTPQRAHQPPQPPSSQPTPPQHGRPRPPASAAPPAAFPAPTAGIDGAPVQYGHYDQYQHQSVAPSAQQQQAGARYNPYPPKT